MVFASINDARSGDPVLKYGPSVCACVKVAGEVQPVIEAVTGAGVGEGAAGGSALGAGVVKDVDGGMAVGAWVDSKLVASGRSHATSNRLKPKQQINSRSMKIDRLPAGKLFMSISSR